MKLITFLIVSFLLVLNVYSQTDTAKVHLNGQVVGWTTAQFENPLVLQPGGRFVPAITGKLKLKEALGFDFEASANLNGNITFEDNNSPRSNGQIKPYRVWGRISNDNFEVRTGLQKINFGQAKLFRPLMWFDGMDVRDPLQLTDGVYGVLGKYFFKNNTNIWLWGLIANDSRKGWEYFATEKWIPELGGRIELPLVNGEIALSTNYRKVHAINLISSRWNDYRLLNENRIGFDGKWDIGVGLWFESSTSITETNQIMVPRYQDLWNVGMDYTLPVGSGIGITLEYFRYHAGNEFFVNGTTLTMLGSMFSYPLSITDNLSAMLFYNPEQNQLFNYVSWSRMLDAWSFYAIGYWNPNSLQMLNFQTNERNLFSGKGIQFMVSYNF